MNHYTIDIEVQRDSDLTADDIDRAMDALAEYGAALGVTPRGHQAARLTVPADSITQAASTAASVAAAAIGGTVIRIDAMTEAEAEARVGEVEVPDLLGVPEAAAILGVSAQRVRQMIAEGKLAAHRVGDRSWALTEAEVTSKAAA